MVYPAQRSIPPGARYQTVNKPLQGDLHGKRRPTTVLSSVATLPVLATQVTSSGCSSPQTMRGFGAVRPRRPSWQCCLLVRRIEVPGRTGAQQPGGADEQVALERAAAAKRYLVAQGVAGATISVNYVSAGDYIADNKTESGRWRNRRVDIEVFRN